VTRRFPFRLAAFYLALFSSVGLQLPYLPVYYRSLGFSGREIAAVGSVSPLAMLFVPPVWGFLADRTGRTAALLKAACAGAAVCLLPLLWVDSFGGILAVVVGYSLFSTSLSGLADALAVVEARAIGTDYARIRLWGSLGFVISAYLFGRHLAGGGSPREVVPLAVGVGAAVAALSVALLRQREGGDGVALAPPRLGEAAALLGEPALVAFLAAAMLHWAAFAPYNLFFAVHLGSIPGGSGYVGPSFALGVLAEAAAMWAFRAVSGRVPLLPLLGFCFLVTAARWVLVVRLGDGLSLMLLQLTHGLSFGVYFVGSVLHVERLVPAQLRATGRALMGAVVFGIGGIAGNALAGVLVDRGGVGDAFGAASLLDVGAAVLLVPAALLARRRVPRCVAPTT
jgi:MFS transporter, PPP family, 3-phenylpropionic acid transporter